MLVIGGLTSPAPSPNRKYAVSRYAAGVPGVILVSIRAATIIATAAASSDGRAPRRPTSRPESGAEISVMIAIGSR